MSISASGPAGGARTHLFTFGGNIKADIDNAWIGPESGSIHNPAQTASNHGTGAQPAVTPAWVLPIAPFSGNLTIVQCQYMPASTTTTGGVIRFVKVAYTFGSNTTTESTIGQDLDVATGGTVGWRYDIGETFSSDNAINAGDALGMFYKSTDPTGGSGLFVSASILLTES